MAEFEYNAKVGRMDAPIVIIIDIEPDRTFVDPHDQKPWEGFERAVPYFQNWRQSLQDSTGKTVSFTWSLRLDPQISETYGDPAWAIKRYQPQLEQLALEGDELGVHVHAYRRTNSSNHWIEDFGDQDWVNACVNMAYETFSEYFPSPPRVFSMGADWINHDTVMLAEQLGMEVEISAIAGAPSRPANKKKYSGIQPDLSRVKPIPYHPSQDDFRIADPERTDGIWVFPMSRIRKDNIFGRLERTTRKVLKLKPRQRWVRSPKIYPDIPLDELKWQLANLVKSDNAHYLTFSFATRRFTWPDSIRLMDKNFDLLKTHRNAKDLWCATPLQVIERL